ncbi:hypothetical protein QQF64_029276 [Cirrhinus molitorella]|uniref:Uncharacterized protein n=1 Tax=Cirrhinus molitorella TaxID=172907 RepID=A0ABR3N983_9TELE
MGMSKFILAEALSVATGVKVKLQSQISDYEIALELDILSLPAVALLGQLPNSGLKTTTSPLISQSSASSLRKELFVIPDEFFDSRYDFDFTNMSNSNDGCMRGGEPYLRPYGWMRFALKVLNKYPDGNAWLGSDGWRSRSVPGEWPVSYHGTGLQGAEGIIKSYYQAGNGKAYGRGIYSTPNITVANMFAEPKKFTSRKNGKTYKVILQNRINPAKRSVHGISWVVPVPEGTSAEQERIIVESAIRPYGLLLQEVKK